MAYRVIQWGTGAVGKHTLRAVLDHPQLELVGLKVYNETKVGRDAGELADRPATGIRAVREMAQLPLAAADCVLYVPMQPDYDEIAALLRAGVSVITTAGLVFAITMFALMSGSVINLLQIGSTIGIGLLIDIVVVRTVFVPAAITALGDRVWWPSKP